MTEKEIKECIENDIKLAREGFEFDEGDLDWYLEESCLSQFKKDQIKRIKRDQRI